MEIKKTEKANLESKKRIFTEIGLILALLIVYGAFEYTTKPKDVGELSGSELEVPDQEMAEVTREPEPPKPEINEPEPEPPEAPEVVETDDEEEDQSDAFEQTEETDDLDDFVFDEPEEEEEKIFQRVEKMPEFPGGDPALLRFINKNLEYPNEAIEMEIEGMVMVQFVVDENGNAKDPEVLKGVSRHLDQAALDVIAKLPKFNPGEQAGKKVKVYYRVPIHFQLQRR
ncbi:MAG: energy transducer TonB [Bacteroidales bacterium]